MVTGPPERTLYEIPQKPLPKSLLGDLALDFIPQSSLPGTLKISSATNNGNSNAAKLDQRPSLTHAKSGVESQNHKEGGVLLYSGLIEQTEPKSKEITSSPRISLKKLALNSPGSSQGGKQLGQKDILNGKNSPSGDGLAYSFVSSNKFKLDTQVVPLSNYDQIYGGSREETDGPSQELSISPTKVRRTHFSQIRNSIRSSSVWEHGEAKDPADKDLAISGCFKTMKIKNGLQLKNLSHYPLVTDHNRPGLLSLEELLIARLPKEVSGVFKYKTLIELAAPNLQPEGVLSLTLMKHSLLCGLNSLPVDTALFSKEDKELYDSLFQILPPACPGFRKSGGVVNIRPFRDHFQAKRVSMLGISKCCLRIMAAMKMGYLFQIDRMGPEEALSKKIKNFASYQKLELRIVEWFNQSWNTLWSIGCDYNSNEDLNYFFDDEQIANIVENPNELKRIKLQILGFRTSDSSAFTLLEEKVIMPSLSLPGYRTIYFGEDLSSHLVVHLTINPL